MDMKSYMKYSIKSNQIPDTKKMTIVPIRKLYNTAQVTLRILITSTRY